MAKRDIAMSENEQLEFLSEPRTLIVTSIDRHGYPHVAPMWYDLEDGKIVFRSFTKSQKIVNLRRNPRIGVLIEAGLRLRGVARADDPG